MSYEVKCEACKGTGYVDCIECDGVGEEYCGECGNNTDCYDCFVNVLTRL